MGSEFKRHFFEEVIFKLDGFTAQFCKSPESKNIAYELRYNAYTHYQDIHNNDEGFLTDKYDLQKNSRTFLLWFDNSPIATVRSSVWSAQYNWNKTEGINTFQQDIQRTIGLQNTIIESGRFAILPNLGRSLSTKAQLILFRIQDLNSKYENSNHIITIVRNKHIPFYERMLGFKKISNDKFYQWLNDNVVLLYTTAAKSREIILEKGMQQLSSRELKQFSKLMK